MKKTIIGIATGMALFTGVLGSTNLSASATAGTGANTQFISKTYNKDYKYLYTKDLYLKEKPTKAQKVADAKKAKKVNSYLLALVKEQSSMDKRAYNNSEKKPYNTSKDFTHKTKYSITKASKTSFTVRYKFYQSFSDRRAGWDYSYRYTDVTVNKKTGSIKATGDKFKK